MTFKEEFALKKFGLNYDRPQAFYSIECSCLPSIVLYYIRVLFACYSIGTLIYSIVFYDTPNWPVFLTNWNLVTNTIYFIWLTILTRSHGLSCLKSPSSNEEHELSGTNVDPEVQEMREDMPLHLKLFWVWANITHVGCIVTVVMYWGFVLEVDTHLSSKYVFSYVNDHGINMVILYIDFCYQVIPFRVLHVFHTIIFAVLYIIVNIVFQFASGDPVYSVMDWEEKTGWSIFYVVLALILCFIAQLAVYGLYTLKIYLKQR